MSRKKTNKTGIPDFVIDAMAGAILPAIRQYLKTEKGKEEYKKWMQDRKQLNKKPPAK